MCEVGIKSDDLVQSAIAEAPYYDNMTLRDEGVGRELDQIPRQSTLSTMIMVGGGEANAKMVRMFSKFERTKDKELGGLVDRTSGHAI